MAKSVKPGDKVEWETSHDKTSGTLEKKQTMDTEIKSHTVKASEDDPQYIVKSEKTGAKAAHKAGSPKKK
jgi:plastocyanin